MRLRKQPHHEDLEFQIAPMVDVLLTLLVFFVSITSASVMRSSKDLTLPVAPNSNEKKHQTEAILNVRWLVGDRGIVIMDEIEYEDVGSIVPILEPRWKANPSYRAVIRADRNTAAAYVQKVMEACGNAGISDISFAVMNKE